MSRETDNELFGKPGINDEKAFEKLFRRYYAPLCLFASHYVKNPEDAEEIVQRFFVDLWEKRDQISIDASVKNYLFRSVKNHCLNYLKHNKIKNRYAQNEIREKEPGGEPADPWFEPGLMEKMEESIQSLPKKRREIFRLSREEGLKYREIAQKLNISEKTVETQMGLALKTLRQKLKPFLPLMVLFF